jgi:hypothetical protein
MLNVECSMVNGELTSALRATFVDAARSAFVRSPFTIQHFTFNTSPH